MSKTTISAALRQQVSKNSRHRCSYCLSQEEVVGMQFTIDHIIPESLGGSTNPENLCLACWDCNLAKQNRIAALDTQSGQMVPFFNPNQQNWNDHFAWQARGELIVGLTATGRATINALRLNRPLLVRARKRWIKPGWHPPQD